MRAATGKGSPVLPSSVFLPPLLCQHKHFCAYETQPRKVKNSTYKLIFSQTDFLSQLIIGSQELQCWHKQERVAGGEGKNIYHNFFCSSVSEISLNQTESAHLGWEDAGEAAVAAPERCGLTPCVLPPLGLCLPITSWSECTMGCRTRRNMIFSFHYQQALSLSGLYHQMSGVLLLMYRRVS